jgi:hypothetical protein
MESLFGDSEEEEEEIIDAQSTAMAVITRKIDAVEGEILALENMVEHTIPVAAIMHKTMAAELKVLTLEGLVEHCVRKLTIAASRDFKNKVRNIVKRVRELHKAVEKEGDALFDHMARDIEAKITSVQSTALSVAIVHKTAEVEDKIISLEGLIHRIIRELASAQNRRQLCLMTLLKLLPANPSHCSECGGMPEAGGFVDSDGGFVCAGCHIVVCAHESMCGEIHHFICNETYLFLQRVHRSAGFGGENVKLLKFLAQYLPLHRAKVLFGPQIRAALPDVMTDPEFSCPVCLNPIRWHDGEYAHHVSCCEGLTFMCGACVEDWHATCNHRPIEQERIARIVVDVRRRLGV